MKSRFIYGHGCTGGCILITAASEANSERENEKIENNSAPGAQACSSHLPPRKCENDLLDASNLQYGFFFHSCLITFCCYSRRKKNQTIVRSLVFMVLRRRGKLQNYMCLVFAKHKTFLFCLSVCVCFSAWVCVCVSVCVWTRLAVRGQQEKKQKGDDDKQLPIKTLI